MTESSIAIKRRQYQRALAEGLDQIVVALSRRPDVDRAILFGSYAEGRCDLFTDLDILIVIRSPLDYLARTAEMYRYLSSVVDMDLLVYTPEELERHRDRPVIRQALQKGRTIYEKLTS